MYIPWTPVFLLTIMWLFRENIRQLNAPKIILLLLVLYLTFSALEIVINAAAADNQNAEDGKVHRAPPSRPRFAGGYYGSAPDENP